MPQTLFLLPQPFDWCEIPAGNVMLGDGWDGKAYGVGETFEVTAFCMAKYPVTNAQYAKFIEAEGYQNKAWWTEDGWERKDRENWIEPHYWADERFVGDDKPVVGVSWYETIAFCHWLSETSGEKISLPTEQEWQWAAQGDDGRKYPWGNNFDKSKTNTYESGIGKTTSVAAYPSGASPFGVLDMVGNVNEWCLNEYATGSIEININIKSRVLRGGSWCGNQNTSFSAYRDYFHPSSREDLYAFRLSLSLQ